MPRTKKPKRTPESFDHVEFQCYHKPESGPSCQFACETGKEFIAHLVSHGYSEEEAKKTKGQMVMHLDASTHHFTSYKLTIGTKQVGAKCVSVGRRKGDYFHAH